MKTGADDIGELGEVVTWNGASHSTYEGDCGRVRGSSDGLFPPGAGSSDSLHSLTFFSTDLCRPLTFSKSGLQTVHGIPVTSFNLDPNNFANGTTCPGNECYQNNVPTGVQVTWTNTSSVYQYNCHYRT